MKTAVRVDWTEYERGWGTRDDGTSLHRDMEAAQAFILKLTGDRSGPVPDEYSSPGEPRIVEVNDELHAYLQHETNYWFSVRKWPTAEEVRNGAIPV